MFKLGVVGFPGLYGGAGVELDSHITLWHGMGIDIHIVPTGDVTNEPLLAKTKELATVHNPKEYPKLKDMPVLAFCNDAFLEDIELIKEYAKKTIFINCMTWLFDAEKKAHKEGLIDLFLYQNPMVQEKNNDELLSINSKFNWKIFTSWFDDSKFPFHPDRGNDKFRFGRISREDADKYSKDTLRVFESMVAPADKSGIILGFNQKSMDKIGQPPEWIRTYPASGITQQEFYAHCSAVIQKCDTFENWPRVCMEAMASGSVLIVDDKGGWQNMIEHGVTGWLCKHDRDFIYYSSMMAYEPEMRNKMALTALEAGRELYGKKKSVDSWREVLEIPKQRKKTDSLDSC